MDTPENAEPTGELLRVDPLPTCSALADKWGKQADMLLAQKKDFVDRGYSSSLIQLWETVAGVLHDCRKELEEAISSQNDKTKP